MVLGGPEKRSFESFLPVLIIAASILFLLLCYTIFYNYVLKRHSKRIKEKVDDDSNPKSYAYNDLGIPQLVSTPSSSSSVSSLPNTPESSLVELHVIPDNTNIGKYALNAV